MPEKVTLWRPTGQNELDLVAKSGWRRWPPRLAGQDIFYPVVNRSYAERIAREWNVAEKGVGYVTSFAVRRSFLDQYEMHRVGDREAVEYWIPADELESFNDNIEGAIMQISEYRGPVPQEEFEQAERAIRRSFPKSWRDYLSRASWIRNSWLSDECYLQLFRPSEAASLASAWEPSTGRHPGIVFIGGDGASELLVLDVEQAEPRVMSVNNGSGGWGEAVEQAISVEHFLAEVEGATFRFKF